MSGHGETPEDSDEEMDDERDVISFGETLYTEDGTPVGEVRGVQAGGVFITIREGFEGLSLEHARSGHEFGEAELMWRCTECGEMGEISGGLPDTCPNCDTPKENLMYWTED